MNSRHYRMADRAFSRLRTSLQVEAVRAALHIRDQVALDLWMDEQAAQRLQDHNFLLCLLPPSMGYGSRTGHQTPHLLSDHCTQTPVKVELAWNETVA